MLPKHHRLPSSELRRVRSAGRKVIDFPFELRFVLRTDNVKRIAIIVPKSADKRAVLRNKQKRITHEALVKFIMPIRCGFDGIITIRKLLITPVDAVEQKIYNLFKHIQ